MKYIECSCESLQKPVRTVSGIVEKNQSLQVLSNILVECNSCWIIHNLRTKVR